MAGNLLWIEINEKRLRLLDTAKLRREITWLILLNMVAFTVMVTKKLYASFDLWQPLVAQGCDLNFLAPNKLYFYCTPAMFFSLKVCLE